jgi:tRNA A37 threonylcarbamoyladenosine modification protein TsaB
MKDRALLLAIDTCGPDDSIALGQQLFGKFHTLGNTQLGGRHTSEALVGHALDLLTMAGVYRTWLSAIVAVNGPGSLSRIRDGLNAVADLARDYQTPVAIVSRLEVLAAASGIPCIALDAGRQEIFLRLAGPSGEPRELLAGAAELASIPPPSRVAFCDKNSAQLLKLAWPATELVKVNGPAAADALMFAVARVDAGEFVDPASLEGHHLCRSDAEAACRPSMRNARRAASPSLPPAPNPAPSSALPSPACCRPRLSSKPSPWLPKASGKGSGG